MPNSRRIWFAFLICALAACGAHAQAEEESIGPKFVWPEVPHSPYEPVTGPLQLLSSPQERTHAIELLQHASQNYRFYVQHAPGFAMHLSFVSNGQGQFEGRGSMEEIWLDDGHKRWTAELGGNVSGRSVYQGHRWAENGSLVIPLRVQMVRSALFWPISTPGAQWDLRTQAVNFHGSTLTCILTTKRLGYAPAGRQWVEKEYCIDERTGLLRVWSDAPGIYAVYDYSSSVQWNGHNIASQITFYEDSGQMLQIHVDGLGEPNLNPADFRPSPEILSQRSAPGNGGPVRFGLGIHPGGRPASGTITPVIIHASLAADGSLLEAEVLTPVDAALAQRAMQVVKDRCHCMTNPNEQEEAIITVEFFSGQT